MTGRLAALVAFAVAALALGAAAPVADAAGERGSAKPRQAAPKAKCAAKRAPQRRRRAARRGCARFTAGTLVGRSQPALPGVPGAFAAPVPFAAAPAPGSPTAVPVATATPTAAPGVPELPPIYSNPFAVQVQAFEFGFQLSKPAVSAGNVRVEFNLVRAEDPHNLFLVRSDGSGALHSFEEEPSGAVVAKTLPLTKGKWILFCSLTGHQAAGMSATLTVD